MAESFAAFAAKGGIEIGEALREINCAGPGTSSRRLKGCIGRGNEELTFIGPEKAWSRKQVKVAALSRSLPDIFEENLDKLPHLIEFLDGQIDQDNRSSMSCLRNAEIRGGAQHAMNQAPQKHVTHGCKGRDDAASRSRIEGRK